jgi:transcriptional regulator with XRE-family HTH domain
MPSPHEPNYNLGFFLSQYYSEVFLRIVGLHKKEGLPLDTLAFIARYEAILKEKKIPKMQFYKDCGITDAAVSQWRKGKTNPAMSTINRIADYLNVMPEFLLTGTGEKEKPTPVSESELDYEIIMKLMQLTPSEIEKVAAFVEGLIAAR